MTIVDLVSVLLVCDDRRARSGHVLPVSGVAGGTVTDDDRRNYDHHKHHNRRDNGSVLGLQNGAQ